MFDKDLNQNGSSMQFLEANNNVPASILNISQIRQLIMDNDFDDSMNAHYSDT